MMWLGRPGALVQLRMPARDYDRAPQLQAAVRRTLGGGYTVDRPIRPSRQWHMSWVWLTRADWTHLHALATRQYGPGPFALIDPATGNFLTPQQASGTDVLADEAGWSVTGSETIASSTAQFWQGSRSLLWSLPASVSSGVLTYSPTAGFGWPTPDGQAWVMSAYCRSGGTDTTFDVRARIRWLNAAGSQVSVSTGTYTAMSSSAWTRVSVTATAPAGAVYVEPGLQVDATDVSAAAQCYVDGSQLEMTELTAWQPGEGLPQVSIVDVDERVPWIERRNGAMTLVEVGA